MMRQEVAPSYYGSSIVYPIAKHEISGVASERQSRFEGIQRGVCGDAGVQPFRLRAGGAPGVLENAVIDLMQAQ